MNGQLRFREFEVLEILADLEALRARWSNYVVRFQFVTTPDGSWAQRFGVWS